ncbi:MAG: restriction endonuclease subunit S [Candidatus Paceibacterota bacterium]|jgi:type I restriction enzyme S subunit
MIWQIKEVKKCLENIPKLGSILRSQYLVSGKFPIIDQGQDFIAGYTNDKSLVFLDCLPVIIFGDHTRALKFIDFPFAVGADGTQILKPDNDFDSKFFYYMLLSLDLSSRGYARHFKLLKESQIPIPPLKTQKEIVEKLDKKFIKLRETKHLQEQAFADTEKILSQTLNEIFEDGKKKYKTTNLGEVAILVRGPFGGSLKKEIFVSKGNCVYEQGNVIDNDIENFRYFITPQKFEEMKRFKVSAGDVLMSCSGTIGKFIIIPEKFTKGIINQALLKITPKNTITVEYLKYALQDYLAISTTHIKGAAIKNIASVKELKQFKISLPPIKDQKEIVKKFDTLSEKLQTLKELQKSQLDDFKKLEKAYLREAFNGELV